MGLFKSKEQRRIDRDIKIRNGLNTLKKQMKELERNEKGYIEKAKRAKRIDAKENLQNLVRAIKKTMSQRIMLEKQLLTIETAIQIKNQTEAHKNFLSAMGAVSKSIAEMFGTADLAKTQVDFEKALAQAESMEQRMNVFLDMSSESIFGSEYSGEEELVSDAEIEKLIGDEAAHDESGLFDKEIQKGLDEISKELKKDTQ